ncbi:lytic murein transglycosylase, partial [Rhizobium ruizarguesonis]
MPKSTGIFALALAAALLPLSCYAAPSKADVETQFETWVQSDLWPEA